MKSWFVTKIGNPEDALKIKEIVKPVPKAGELLIKVKAFSLNFFDILQCQGKYQEKPNLPFTPGAEAAGYIEDVGEGTSFKKGDRVLITPQLPSGAFSEYVTVKEDYAFLIPDGLMFEDAAAMYITYHTSYYALESRGNLREGESLLVHAGAGGVGTAAIQIGKAFGAKVIATAGSTEKLDICMKAGADVVVNYNEDDFVNIVKKVTDGKGADVIFDPVGGDVFHKSRKCIAFNGRLLTIGFASGTIPEVPINHVLIKDYSIVGVHFGYYRELFPDKVRLAHEHLMDLYKLGKIKPLIFHQYDFYEVIDALTNLESRETWGKSVVKI